MNSFDALLVVSFGGPEKREDVMPFLENVLRGRNVPRERMLEVAEHYYHFDGRSPINDQNRQLIAALEQEFKNHGVKTPIYWGNRNWHPLLPETLKKMQAGGERRGAHHISLWFVLRLPPVSRRHCAGAAGVGYGRDAHRKAAEFLGSTRVH
jgi:protoheme ferro-lyase